MTWKMGTVAASIAFGVTLAYYLGSKLSTEAINVAVGVLCGMAASLPVSFGLLVALTRQREPVDEQETHKGWHPTPSYGAPRSHVPQVIVVAPPQGQYTPGSVPFAYPVDRSLHYPNYPLRESDDVIEGRDWRLVGEDE